MRLRPIMCETEGSCDLFGESRLVDTNIEVDLKEQGIYSSTDTFNRYAENVFDSNI